MTNKNNQCDAAVNYGIIHQMNKKEDGKERKPIFPVTPIQAVYDARTGASLEAILAQFNAIYVQYQGTPEATRNIIPEVMRRAGLTITYMDMESNTITERASSAVQKDNDHWGLDVNWSRVDELSLSGDISVSSKGTWIINGKDTGVKALGPKGDTGLTPWLKTIDNKLHFSYDNVTWEPCSENIGAWFRFNATSSDSQAGTIGRIQISRDNKTWNDLSPEFRNYLRVQGYVATTSALPANQVVGTIYGVGPTYAADDTAQTNPIYRIYVWNGSSWVDNGQFTSIAAGVVQETGDSETEVMSQKAVSTKLSELGSKILDIEKDSALAKNSFLARTLSNYKIVGEGNKILQANDGTSVLFFEVGENILFEVEAQTFLSGNCIVLVDSISPQSYSVLHSKDSSEIYTYKGETTSDLKYVAIQIDNDTQYSCVQFDAYTGADIKNDFKNVSNEINDMRFVIIGSAEMKRNLSNYKLVNSSTRPLIGNTSTDVVYFYLGKNIKFKIRGTCSIDGCVYALADNISPSQWNFKDATYGSYEIIGETTEELSFVAMTIDKNSEYSCEILSDIKNIMSIAAQQQRTVVKIYTSDTQVEILDKMLEAYNKGYCDVSFEKGIYIFDSIYLYMLNDLNWSWTMELPIGNNCRYYFNGSTLISNKPDGDYSESRNVLGCKAGTSNKMNYELYDGTIINNGGTYCVHDECSRGTDIYRHGYYNMVMQYNQGDDTEYLSKCIGGGAGVDGYIVIDNCVFENNNLAESAEDVSWHGLIGSTNPISINLLVTNSYFSRMFRVGSSFKDSDSIFVKYSGNSHAVQPNIESYAKKFVFCNEER